MPAGKNREEYNVYMAKYMKKWIARRRVEATEQLGGKCVRCGSSENLEFDHVNRDPDPRSRGGRGTMWTFSKARLQAELAKCQLLCHDCHHRKTVECRETGGGWNKLAEDVFIHGTVRMYQYKACRCKSCKQAKRLYRHKLIKIDEVTYAKTCPLHSVTLP